MKKINFLMKLHKENKLLVVEPSNEVKEAYWQRSNESLSSAKASIKTAEQFISEMHDFIAKLTEEETKSYREKAIQLFSEDDEN